ncbi:hypothetical protein GF322_00520 [Candidatus Dependentiae bacterium]|nr:hypothetical protein [Candidatus Dependentiae bacterium]
MLNKQSGNMYKFVTHTWNPIKGKCSHNCKYCYMKVWGKQKPARLVKKELKDDLGAGNFIFVGSSCDMWADDIPMEWVVKVLKKCKEHNNKYLFQSKNPERFVCIDILDFPKNMVLGTTIESNKMYNISNAPNVEDRVYWLSHMSQIFETTVTIEPILDFELSELVDLIKRVSPTWINIGADSKGHGLPEPSKKKIDKLVKELKKVTKVNLKKNLNRLL